MESSETGQLDSTNANVAAQWQKFRHNSLDSRKPLETSPATPCSWSCRRPTFDGQADMPPLVTPPPSLPAATATTPCYSSSSFRRSGTNKEILNYLPPTPLSSCSSPSEPSPSGSSPLGSKKRAGKDCDSPYFKPLDLLEGDDDEPKTPKRTKSRLNRGYAAPETYAHLSGLTDVLLPNLDMVVCGINPGLKSAQLGQPYASPTNHFWPTLHQSGFTPRRLDPSEYRSLPEYGIGCTNLVVRPSAEQAELSKAEMKASVPALLRKLVAVRPKLVCFVGMGIFEVVLKFLWHLPAPGLTNEAAAQRRRKLPKVSIGHQPVTISFAPDGGGEGERPVMYLYAVPSSSARVVSYQLVDKIEIWKALRDEVGKLRATPGYRPWQAEFSTDYPAETLPLDGPDEGALRIGGGVKFEKASRIKLEAS